jgi:hypothetical protein
VFATAKTRLLPFREGCGNFAKGLGPPATESPNFPCFLDTYVVFAQHDYSRISGLKTEQGNPGNRPYLLRRINYSFLPFIRLAHRLLLEIYGAMQH